MIKLVRSGKSECCDVDHIMKHVCVGSPKEIEIPLNSLLGEFTFKYVWPSKKDTYWIRNDADKFRAKCVSLFCADGYNTASHCGVGECTKTLRGNYCNCKLGCRKGKGISKENMGLEFRITHGLTTKALQEK